jgi:uncharacterized membrane protein
LQASIWGTSNTESGTLGEVSSRQSVPCHWGCTEYREKGWQSKDSEKGGPTNIIVSLVVEIKGDETNFENAGFSRQGTKEVLTSIASDCIVDDGYCLNAAEIFWTPGDREEVLTKNDIILDFPTLIDL